MSTAVYARNGCGCPGPEVGYRVGIGNHQTAFQWLVVPGAMEQFAAFEDEYGREYDRAGLMEFVRECDEEHPYRCQCNPTRHPAGMWS